MTNHPNDLDRALAHRGLPPGNVGMLLAAVADVLASWERAGTAEEWDAWRRSEAGAEAMPTWSQRSNVFMAISL